MASIEYLLQEKEKEKACTESFVFTTDGTQQMLIVALA